MLSRFKSSRQQQKKKKETQQSVSSSNIFHLTHRWTINDYLRVVSETPIDHYVYSPKFSCFGDDSAKRKFSFMMCIRPKQSVEADHMGVFLINKSDVKLDVNFNFLVEKSAEGIALTSLPFSCQEVTMAPNKTIGSREEFSLTIFSDLKPGDSLTIVCDMQVFYDNSSTYRNSYNNNTCTRTRSFAQFIGNTLFSDVTLVCQDRAFPCHRVVLAARSDVFKDLCKNNKKGNILISDANPDAVDRFVHFLYTDDMKAEDELQLLPLAHRYNVILLKNLCERSLCAKVSMENVMELLLLAHLNEAKDLEKIALDFINLHSGKVLVMIVTCDV